MMRISSRVLLVLPWTLAGAMQALAAEHGGSEAAHGSDAAAWTTLGFSFVNFSIFLILAYRYGWWR